MKIIKKTTKTVATEEEVNVASISLDLDGAPVFQLKDDKGNTIETELHIDDGLLTDQGLKTLEIDIVTGQITNWKPPAPTRLTEYMNGEEKPEDDDDSIPSRYDNDIGLHTHPVYSDTDEYKQAIAEEEAEEEEDDNDGHE